MNSTLRVTVVAAVLALASARAAAAPLTGRWEGALDGRKAVSLELRDAPALEGKIVFYILRDNGNGERNGDAASVPMAHLNWDGEVLRFDVDNGGHTVAFQMRPAGNGKATLKRLAADGTPEVTIVLSALR